MPILIKILRAIADPRTGNAKRHKIETILLIALAAIISGAHCWNEIAKFGNRRKEFIAKYADVSNGAPSHDTFNRVLVLPEPWALEKCCKEWAKTLRRLETFDVPGFDGETVGGAGSRGDKATLT